MTLLEYVENPMGKGSMILPNTKMKQGFIETFRNVSDSMKITWYKVQDNYIAIIGIPSSSGSKRGLNFNYDIVFHFNQPSSLNKAAIMNAEWSVYSNSPSFIYTYAHVFYKKGMICKWLESKLGRTIKTISPNIRNQYNVIGYERSLYLSALKVIQSMTNALTINGSFLNPVKANYTHLSSLVKSLDEVTELSIQTKKDSVNITTPNKVSVKNKNTSHSSSRAGSSGKTSKVSTIKKIGKTPKTRKI